MQTILMALDQDSGRAEASVLRAQLLKFMYSLLFTSQGQAALGKAKAQKYLTAEACETARKVYSDPVAVAADREYARGLLAGALKDSASKLTDRPFLGISPYLVEPGAKTITSACKVASVALGSPAALAGIVRGDLIVRFNDKPIASLDDFDAALAAEKAGNSVTIVVRRGMDEHPIPIVLGEPR